ncbi:MAG: magnesium transporter [Candidatus Woesearchaeota archaeon]
MKIFDKGFKDIAIYEFFSIAMSLVAGTFLAVYTDKLILVPGMLLLMPGFLEMRGNISGSFASRLSSGLFLRLIKPSKMNTRIIRGNLLASFILAFLISLFLGIFAFLFSYYIFGIYELRIIILPVVAGIIANAVEIPFTLFATFYFFSKGHDPNNIMGPLITSTGDVTSIVALLIAVAVI